MNVHRFAKRRDVMCWEEHSHFFSRLGCFQKWTFNFMRLYYYQRPCLIGKSGVCDNSSHCDIVSLYIKCCCLGERCKLFIGQKCKIAQKTGQWCLNRGFIQWWLKVWLGKYGEEMVDVICWCNTFIRNEQVNNI